MPTRTYICNICKRNFMTSHKAHECEVKHITNEWPKNKIEQAIMMSLYFNSYDHFPCYYCVDYNHGHCAKEVECGKTFSFFKERDNSINEDHNKAISQE